MSRAEVTFLRRTSSSTDEKRLLFRKVEEGELIISKDLGPPSRHSPVGEEAPKVQLESLILAQNER